MKKYFCLILSAVLAVSALSFTACQKKTPQPEENPDPVYDDTSRATTSKPVEIVEIPTSKEGRVSMFNSALDFFDLYCYSYNKSVKCEVSDVNVGSLSTASNAVKAFRSIFGETEKQTYFDYQAGRESFTENLIKSGFKATDIESAETSHEGDEIILTLKFADESNPNDELGQLHKLTSEYVGTEKVNSNLSEFSSSAASVNITVSDITVTVVLNSFDSSVKSMTVSFRERFLLGSVQLVQLEGASVTGTSRTTIIYDKIK